MQLNFMRINILATGVALSLAVSLVQAQVTIDLTTTEDAGCTVVTDAQGLRLAPNGTALQATGVSLTGSGCGGGTSGAGAEFGATVQAPASVVVGTPFNVTWSAAADAARCTYSGSTGVSGWPVGSTACEGTDCTNVHNSSVVVSNAINYSFALTCTNSSGYAQSQVSAQGGGVPPSPDNFPLVVPASATVGLGFSVSWNVQNATACSGSASLNGNSTNLPGWTDTTSADSPRTVTPSQAGTYTLRLNCSNAAGSVVSQFAAVPVGGGGTESCPTGRLTTASIRYPNVPGSGVRGNVDLTRFENIWGHSSNTDTAIAWPGRNSAVPAIQNWGKTQYIAAKFNVPASAGTSAYETLRYSTYYSGPELTLSVSTQCGDFQPVNPLCLSTGVGTGDAFKKIVLFPHTNGCPILPGTDYYINVKMTDPAPADCNSASTCTLATTNTVGSQ